MELICKITKKELIDNADVICEEIKKIKVEDADEFVDNITETLCEVFLPINKALGEIDEDLEIIIDGEKAKNYFKKNKKELWDYFTSIDPEIVFDNSKHCCRNCKKCWCYGFEQDTIFMCNDTNKKTDPMNCCKNWE